MGHTLVIAGAKYQEVSKVIFQDENGTKYEYLDADDVYQKEERDIILVFQDRSMVPADGTVLIVSKTEPAIKKGIWLKEI